MAEICGIIGDLKREEQGVYVFPCLTLLGYDSKEEPVRKIKQLGFKVGDEDPRYEGVEVKQSSPFKLMRVLAKEYGYKPLKAINTVAPGGRTCLMWTLIGGQEEGGMEAIGIVSDIKRESEGEYVIPTSTIFGLGMDEVKQLVGEGLKIGDEDPRNDGVEVRGASPFKVMRILCSKYGWTTDGDVVSTEAPGGRTAAMWTLTRKVA
eukprot:GFUD01000796.1.p1 GENE.GFUD01000796.1~~GFUD01000796.1.p1  ORF type:complete len:206 (-),score=78.67 GFUD01000796.1:94-711(-)